MWNVKGHRLCRLRAHRVAGAPPAKGVALALTQATPLTTSASHAVVSLPLEQPLPPHRHGGMDGEDDVQDIKKQIQKTSKRVDEVATSVDAARQDIEHADNRIATLDKRVTEMKQQAAASTTGRAGSPMRRTSGRTSTSSRRTSTGGSAATADDEWRPRIMHWRGWAPNGSGEASKITKSEAEKLHQILEMVPNDMKDRVKFLSPFVVSHSLSLDTLVAGASDAKLICDMVNLELKRRPISVRGTGIRGSVERRARRAVACFGPCSRTQGPRERLLNTGRMFPERIWPFALFVDRAYCACAAIALRRLACALQRPFVWWLPPHRHVQQIRALISSRARAHMASRAHGLYLAHAIFRPVLSIVRPILCIRS